MSTKQLNKATPAPMTTAQKIALARQRQAETKPAPTQGQAEALRKAQERALERAAALELMGDSAPTQLGVKITDGAEFPTTYGEMVVPSKVFNSGRVGYWNQAKVVIGGKRYQIQVTVTCLD